MYTIATHPHYIYTMYIHMLHVCIQLYIYTLYNHTGICTCRLYDSMCFASRQKVMTLDDLVFGQTLDKTHKTKIQRFTHFVVFSHVFWFCRSIMVYPYWERCWSLSTLSKSLAIFATTGQSHPWRICDKDLWFGLFLPGSLFCIGSEEQTSLFDVVKLTPKRTQTDHFLWTKLSKLQFETAMSRRGYLASILR